MLITRSAGSGVPAHHTNQPPCDEQSMCRSSFLWRSSACRSESLHRRRIHYPTSANGNESMHRSCGDRPGYHGSPTGPQGTQRPSYRSGPADGTEPHGLHTHRLHTCSSCCSTTEYSLHTPSAAAGTPGEALTRPKVHGYVLNYCVRKPIGQPVTRRDLNKVITKKM